MVVYIHGYENMNRYITCVYNITYYYTYTYHKHIYYAHYYFVRDVK